jgi:hypothetical protein
LTLFCADVTKLIAGDSWLSSSLIRDPESAKAFAELTTVMSNPTDRFFFKRQHLNAQHLGPLANTWIESANVTELPPPIQNPSTTEIWMDPEKAKRFKRVFRKQLAALALRWVQFQSWDRRLMRVYWSDNTEEEMITAYEPLVKPRAHLKPLQDAFRAITSDSPIPIVRQSQEALADLGRALKRTWTDEELAIAFLAWNYVKAFRYLATITSADQESVYLVHFMRRPAIDYLKNTASCEPAPFLFPWGDFLQIPDFQENLSDGYKACMDDLRVYTQQEFAGLNSKLAQIAPKMNSPSATERRGVFKVAATLTHEFAREGLMKASFLRDSGDVQRVESWIRWLIPLVAASAWLFHQDLLHPALEYLEFISLRSHADERVAESLVLWQTRWEIGKSLEQKKDAVIRFLRAKGIELSSESSNSARDG